MAYNHYRQLDFGMVVLNILDPVSISFGCITLTTTVQPYAEL